MRWAPLWYCGPFAIGFLGFAWAMPIPGAVASMVPIALATFVLIGGLNVWAAGKLERDAAAL